MAEEHDLDEAFAKDEVITLTDEDGQEHEFALLDVIEVDDREYAILVPTEEEENEEEEGQAVILRLERDADGDEVLVDIEDEEEWNRVAEAYEEMLLESDEDEFEEE